MLLLAIFSLLFVSPSFAAEVQSTVNPETTFIFNTLLFLICGFLVMFIHSDNDGEVAQLVRALES